MLGENHFSLKLYVEYVHGMNEISATRLQVVLTDSCNKQKNTLKFDCQKWTLMYRVIFVTLLSNKWQSNGVSVND